ncbi:hypothetical protein NAF17_02565 [Mucilaginibacter sp. RB4R14]|uniref:hypothetical protein n=1 Tax=Mucilaginibacter aurantiaciroseus TaxID=2949308 RepID=UPI002091275A|nr:hypothetical protein [Mucilaginibacter aurantiaciroseus]MCO5934410.1 hypothetical protein [Mucilaginibacter aurantiaciroseus]
MCLRSEPVPTGKKVYITASDSSVVHIKGDAYALNKWGAEAKKGVIELFGKSSIIVK